MNLNIKSFTRGLFVLLFVSANSWAFSPQTFHLSHSFETLTLEDSLHSKHTLFDEDNPWLFGVSYNYQDDPLIQVNSTGTSFVSSIVEKYHSFDFAIARFISFGEKRGLIGVRSKYNHININNKGTSSLGDTNISMKVQLDEGESHAFSITPFVDIPTGDKNNFSSDDSFGFGILGGYEKHWDDFHLVANLGFRHAKNAILGNVDLSNKIIAGISGTIDFTETLSGIAELKGEFGTPFADDQNPVEILAGLKYKVDPRINTFFGVGLGGFDFDNVRVNTTSGDYRLFLGVKWIPETRKQVIIEEKVTTIERDKLQNILHVLKHVRFHFDTARLTKKSKKILKFVAKVLRKHKKKIRLIYIQGHTDSVGSREYNKDLSKRRSASVAKFLAQQKGINKSLFVPQGFGEERPIVKEKNDRDRAINRRVEFNIIYH